ncbi:Peptidase family S41 [Mesonia phycicola]|uniref:Peptidase family S41 n=2 Tax=Mesonia phycicola TaxID=579105 RepID=A0A1M6HZU8_9FLAO|nr:Peptidase family S41 [Mesonia phycicola]
MKKILFSLIVIFIFQKSLSQSNNLSRNDKKAIKQMIKKFENFSINKDSIKWDLFENKVWQSAKTSKDSAVITALILNGDKHSSYYDQASKSYLYGKLDEEYKYEKVTPFQKQENIGYVKIETFINNRNSLEKTLENGVKYINGNIEKIKEQDSRKLKGWIIDLRENQGGNMWPMLISLTPFLEDGILGYFYVGKKLDEWSKKENQIFDGSVNKTNKFIGDPVNYKLKNDNLKIAVLINGNTASSGEATAIALMNNPNIKFFGSKSAGYTTSNKSISLKNNDLLILTSGVMTDYKKKKYWNGINPRIIISNNSDLVKEITDWFE